MAVYSDYVYRRSGATLYAERAFALFVVGLRGHVEQLTVIGRLDPNAGATHYPVPEDVAFVAVPHFSSLTRPVATLSSLLRSLHRFWRTLDDVDRAWLLGPSPHALAFALLCLARRRTAILGVRQDYPTYVRSRWPGRRWMHIAADLLEAAWRALGRVCPVIVVGPELAGHYRHARRLLPITVSLVTAADIERGEHALARRYDGDGELRVLSVGRLEREKNPLLLADVFARLRASSPRWRLVVCGEGPLAPELAGRLAELGLQDDAELVGYLALHAGLLELYRSCHAFLHVSLTEGVPQVLVEAFASGLPVIATAVGGVPEAAAGAALLIAPEDPGAAVAALERVVAEPALRAELIRAGFERAHGSAFEAVTAQVADFIRG
jgi:glycosyltransferase involved in cell wall biosynthesis